MRWQQRFKLFLVIVFLPLTGGAALAATTQAQAQAQNNFPARPITMLVGFSAGGATDNAARVVAEELSRELGQPVVVSNRPGAGGVRAIKEMMEAPTDGYTIMLMSNGPVTVMPARHKNLDYDAINDFMPIGLVASYPHILVASPKSDFKTLKEIINRAKIEPGALKFAQIGSVNNLAIDWLKSAAGIDVATVPYEGAAAVVNDLANGTVDLALLAPSVAYPLAEASKGRLIATTSATGLTKARNIPSIAESGTPEIDLKVWNGLVAPKGTDPAVVARLAAALAKVQKRPELQEKLALSFLDVLPGGPEEFKALLDKESERWRKVVTTINPVLP